MMVIFGLKKEDNSSGITFLGKRVFIFNVNSGKIIE
jgi:hypothetical protein